LQTARTSLDLSRLRSGIRPFRLHWFPRLRSTNDHAAVLRRRGVLFAPAMVLAGRQQAGRGRAGRSWWSGPGVLTVTFVLAVEEHLSPHQLPLIAGLAVRNAAAELAGEQSIGLKWPNDLVFSHRKLAGLLCERIDRADLVGLGMNVNTAEADVPAELRGRIISLSQIAGRSLDMTDVLIRISTHLHRLVSERDRTPFPVVAREYDAYHVLIDRKVTVASSTDVPAISGRCEGIDSSGRLLLREQTRLHRIVSGHVLPDWKPAGR
jgi:BirA family transcriptional regulator, biotin operon repressor / biotin---[acetyl-CoA-carboxylase] ligase